MCTLQLNEPVQKLSSALPPDTTDLTWDEEFTLCVQLGPRGLGVPSHTWCRPPNPSIT